MSSLGRILGSRDLLASTFLTLYEGHVLGYVSYVNAIYGDCFITRVFFFLDSMEDYD